MLARFSCPRTLLSLCCAAGLLLAACQQQQATPTAAPTKPAATAKPAAVASPAASPVAAPVASPSPAASPAASPSPAALRPPVVPSPAAVASPSPGPATDENLVAAIRDPSNDLVGTALFSQESGGVRVLVQVADLPPGPHGIHIHAVGQCDPPEFMSAGGHFNPTSAQHGLQNPQGPHAGDLPNIEIMQDGSGQLNVVTDRISLRAGPNSVLDADGSAIVIHTSADDQVTDPTGNSGGRIACGVIRRG